MQQSLSYYTRAQENGQPVPAEKLRKVFISYKKTDDPLGDKKTAIIKEILDCYHFFFVQSVIDFRQFTL